MEEALTIHVAKNGDDEWSGRLPEPNSSRTDGPFATVERARDEIRAVKKAKGFLDRPVRVLIRGGIYFLRRPIVFTPEDSGTKDCKVTYMAHPNEKAIISGGVSVRDWTIDKTRGIPVYVSEVKELKNNTIRNLWINNQRRFRTRFPKKGYLKMIVPEGLKRGGWNEGQSEFYFHDGDLKPWHSLENAEVIAMNRWVESHLPVAKIDGANNLITFKKQSVFQLEGDDLYYVENVLDLLSEPGEWFFDSSSCKLYYIPLEHEDVENIDVIVPILPQLIRFEGKPEEKDLVEHLEFSNLAFSHTEWQLPEDASGYPQAAVDVKGAVYGEGVSNCRFESCEFSHLGTYAIELSRGCSNNVISRCELFDLGAGGIKIGEKTLRSNEEEQSHGNRVTHCGIHNGGLIFHSAVAVWIGESYGNEISHNTIYDFYYTGISIGWTWGYGNNLARENRIESNHIHHIGKLSDGEGPILSDMGGVYTLGKQPGTRIRFNVIHDVSAFKYGGWGIYLDEGSSHILVENNVVYRTTHGGFHQHYGEENIVRNNIFAFGREAQIQRSRAEPHVSFIFEHNIVYYDEGVLLVGDSKNLNVVFDYNLYWNKDEGRLLFFDLSFEEWQKRGMDRNSLIADPLFASPERGDFSLKQNSPAVKIGFAPLAHVYPI